MVTNRCPSPAWDDAAWPFEATFDGGARCIRGLQVVGVGATVWEHDIAGAPPRKIASASVAIPWDANAQVAEAIGCRTALMLLSQVQTSRRAARIVGDNLAVVRYCAGTARLRRPSMQSQLEASLQVLLERGWQLTWQAVRRRLNASADALATQGVLRATELAANGQRALQADTVWHEQ